MALLAWRLSNAGTFNQSPGKKNDFMQAMVLLQGSKQLHRNMLIPLAHK